MHEFLGHSLDHGFIFKKSNKNINKKEKKGFDNFWSITWIADVVCHQNPPTIFLVLQNRNDNSRLKHSLFSWFFLLFAHVTQTWLKKSYENMEWPFSVPISIIVGRLHIQLNRTLKKAQGSKNTDIDGFFFRWVVFFLVSPRGDWITRNTINIYISLVKVRGESLLQVPPGRAHGQRQPHLRCAPQVIKGHY